ncbi:hypothetical protein D1007_45614 [Hordeum vulgare]|nr:hypothetical protein D1007_45614 [Hordeum vulgare]
MDRGIGFVKVNLEEHDTLVSSLDLMEDLVKDEDSIEDKLSLSERRLIRMMDPRHNKGRPSGVPFGQDTEYHVDNRNGAKLSNIRGPMDLRNKSLISNHSNIASYIPFKLSIHSGNYSKGQHLLWYILCKYRVEDHVLEEVDPLHANPTWHDDDITIVVLVYGTISHELFDHSSDITSFRIWGQLEIFFCDNTASHAVHNGADFRTTIQGNMKIAQYCHRL